MKSFDSLKIRLINQMGRRFPEKVCLIQVPKCGSSSVSNAIKSFYLNLDPRKDQRVYTMSPAASSLAVKVVDGVDFPRKTDDDYCILAFRERLLAYCLGANRYDFVTGHFTFSDRVFAEFGDIYSFVTMLRDPVKRWVSSYFYNRDKGSQHCRVDQPLEQYLDSAFGVSQGHELIKFIGGPVESGDYRSEAAIRRAKENLDKFALVGILEHQEYFLRSFEERYGVMPQIAKLNQNPVGKALQAAELTEQIKKQVREVCAPDLDLYEYALSRIVK